MQIKNDMQNLVDKNSTSVIAAGVSVSALGNAINYAKYNKISHQSHIVLAGVIASGLTSGYLNYKRFKNDEVSKYKVASTIVKETTQGSIASAATTISAKYYTKKNYLGMMAAIGLGVAGVALTEKVSLRIKIKK